MAHRRAQQNRLFEASQAVSQHGADLQQVAQHLRIQLAAWGQQLGQQLHARGDQKISHSGGAALAHLDGVEITDAFSDRDLADRLEDVLVPRDE